MTLNESKPRRAWMEVDVPRDRVDVEDVRWFFEQVRARVVAKHLVGLPDSGPLHGKNLVRHLGSFGSPGIRFGLLTVLPTDRPVGGSVRAWTDDSWKLLMTALGRDPVHATASISTLNEYGDTGAGEVVTIEVSRRPGVDVTQFAVKRSSPSSSAAEFDAELHEWLDLFRNVIERLPAVEGFIADDNRGEQGATPLELGLRYAALEWVDSGLLRQYAWATFVPEAALEMVGGSRCLSESGAFVDVREIADRGAVAIATRVPSEYEDVAVEKVFRALAPALPAGELARPSVHSGPYKLVYEDAAHYGARELDE